MAISRRRRLAVLRAIGEMEGRTSHGPNNLRLHDAVSVACGPLASRSKAGYDYDSEFIFGLDVILDGLERLLSPR